jgi:hypothetical protein
VSLLLFFSSNASALSVDAVALVQRVQQNTSTTIDLHMTRDGQPADPEPATARVTITRDDGTVIVDNALADRQGVGHFTYMLAAAQTAQLDWLTATWDLTVDDQPQYASTRIEVVGGFLIGLGDLRNDRDLTNAASYSTDALANARVYAEQELEQACGVAFVPRYTRESVRPTRSGDIMLRPRVRALRAVTRAGAVLVDAATLTWDPIGTLSLAAGLVPAATAGTTAIDVAYEHGYDQPPAAVSQAALIVAKDYLVRGPMDDRAIQRATDEGPVFIATPGFQGKRFGIPTVDAVVGAYGMPALVG